MAAQKVKLWTQVRNAKRSFGLLPSDVNSKNMILMASVSDPEIVVDEKTNTTVLPNQNGDFIFDWKFDVEYQVRKRIPKETDSNNNNTKSNTPQWIKSTTLDELKNAAGQRKRVAVGEMERDVLVFYYKGQVYAIDSVCYHLGGPLIEGDIEEVGGRACIVCPWHRYKITLDNGEGLFQREEIKSVGKRQRSHKVKVDGNDVYVQLDTDPEELPSDLYAYLGLYKLPTSRTPSKTPVHSKIIKQ